VESILLAPARQLLIAGLARFFMALGYQTNLFPPGPRQFDARMASLKINPSTQQY
jgi:hypothetical protein